MSDLIRLAGRRMHTDLYDAELHDLTVEWIAGQFGFNGPMRRFAPPHRTSGGIATADPGCDNADVRACGENQVHPADTDNDLLISPQEADAFAEFWLSLPAPTNESERLRYESMREEVLRVASVSQSGDGGYYDDGISPRRCGFAYVVPLDAENVPSEVGASADGARSRNREVGEDQFEPGQVNGTRCDCPRRDIPVAGSGRYFALPGLRFPMVMRSSACNPEYIGDQVAEWLWELDEVYRLVLAGWEIPAVPQPEPPVRAPAVAERVDLLRTAIREFLEFGETDLRLIRLPGGVPGEGEPGAPC